jgi:hypothetical protein
LVAYGIDTLSSTIIQALSCAAANRTLTSASRRRTPDISGRYERGSILLTSNRELTEWPDLFHEPLLASAGLDRFTHGAQVVIITGRSYRAHGDTQAPTP